MVDESTVSVLREVITRLEEEIGKIERQRDGLVVALQYLENSSDASKPSRDRTASDMRDAMVEILAEESPLGRRDIYDRLVERGIHVGGRDPVNNVGAHLSIDSRFGNVGRGMWVLADADRAERVDNTEPDSGFDASHDEDDSNQEDDVAW